MGIFERNLVVMIIKYVLRWLMSNDKNRKVFKSGFDLLDQIDRVATGEDQVAADDGEGLNYIHKMIDDWLTGKEEKDG